MTKLKQLVTKQIDKNVAISVFSFCFGVVVVRVPS